MINRFFLPTANKVLIIQKLSWFLTLKNIFSTFNVIVSLGLVQNGCFLFKIFEYLRTVSQNKIPTFGA